MRLSQTSLQYKVLKNIKENELINPGDKIIAAVSGGADSVCLFDVLSKLKKELKIELIVCHFNHKLRGRESERDFEFVRKMAEERGVEFVGGEAESGNLIKSEESARDARYAFFEKILKEGRGGKVAIAHNKNDFVETFFLRLVRGSGMRGLKSIPYRRQNFIRPLLAISRSEVEVYVKKEGLDYINDATNDQIDFTRNNIRLQILPLFLKINPNLLDTISGNIVSLEEDYDLLDGLILDNYKEILIEEDSKKIILSRKKWLLLQPAFKTGVIRLAISNISSLDNITFGQIRDVVSMLNKGEGKKFKPLPHSLRVSLESGKIIVLVANTK
jgi:tRNA(Ile)-lysidine synthase